MEITRLPLPNTAAPRAQEKLSVGPATDDGRALRLSAEKVAERRALKEALAQAILEQSDVPASAVSKVRVRLDIHKETGRLIAAIENKETGKLVQTIPSETILRGAAMLERVVGTVLDKPA